MSKQYKVLKDFPHGNHIMYKEGNNIAASNLNQNLTSMLLNYGFIEEIKESSRWRAKDGQDYYVVLVGDRSYDATQTLEVASVMEIGQYNLDENYNLGNYFKREETAQKVADALKLFFEYLHTPDVYGLDDYRVSMDFTKFYEARAAVLEDDKENTQ